jgi:hypothetical protein
MKLVTRAEMARLCGVSKPGIAKAIKLGVVNLIGDGRSARIDITDPVNVDYINREEHNCGGKNDVRSTPGTKSDNPLPPPPSSSPDRPVINSLDDINETNLFLLTKSDIDKLKAYEQALSARLKREESRGKLISRTLVRSIFHKLYTVDNNELKSMEDKLTPSICGLFGEHDDSENAVAVRKLLNNEITKALRHIKRILNDHLKKIEVEKI